MFLLKNTFKVFFFSHELRFVMIKFLSQFEFLKFVTILVFEFYHNLSFVTF